MDRDRVLPKAIQTCKSFGAKAVKSRTFETRELHRTTAKLPASQVSSAVKVNGKQWLDENLNRFQPLHDSADEAPADSLPLPNDTRPEIISSPRPRKNKRKKFEEFLFRVGTHNWNGNANIGIASRETYYNRKNFDIIAVTETRMNPRINGKFRSGKYKWFGCANEDGHGGVGFLVGLHLAPYVTVLKHSFKNQLWIRIAASRGTDADMFLCAAYMPQESALLADADAAWAALAEAWTKYSTKGVVAVLGDLNAKPAVPENEIEARLFGSNYPDGHRSRNGRLLARMVAQVGAVVLNGHSTRRDGQPWTTFSRFNETAQREIRSMLDFILVAPELRIQNCKSEFGVDDVDLDSDHYLTWARLRCPRKRDGRRRKPAHKRFKLHLLKPTHRPHHKAPPSAQSSQASPASSQSPPLSPASAPPTSQQNSKDDPSEQHRDHYEAKLIDAFEGFELAVPDHLTSEEDRVSAADEAVGDFIQRTFTALRSSVGEQTVNPRFSRSWFDQECRSAIDQRRRIYRLYKAAPTTESWQRYKCERLRVRRLIRRKKQEDWEKFLKSLADDFGTNMKGCWSKVNRLLPKSAKSGSHPIRMANGLLASSHSDRLSAAASYREELGRALYRPTFDAGFKAQAEEEVERMLFDSPLQEDDADLDGTISPDEVKAVLARAATGKAAGKDQTRNSMFKYGGATMVDQLTELFNWLRELEVTPSDWGHAVIINLFKDGDPADMGNYRGISLISCLGKLYLGVWAARLSNHLEPRLSEEQCGFRAKRSTVDQIAALNDILVRRRRASKPTYLLFVDFRKAFDTVWRDGLWKRLWEVGVRGKAWRIVKGVYRDVRLSVLVDGDHTRLVPAEQGVRQGCPLSPILFDAFVDELVNMLKRRKCGLAFGHSDAEVRRRIAALMYADDVVLMADSASDLQIMVDVVFEFCNKWRIEVNTKKSQIMIIDEPGKGRSEYLWKYGDTELDIVRHYKYLGVIFSDDLTWTKHSVRVVDKVKASLVRLGILLTRKELPVALKTLVWDAVAGSVLQYATEVWEAPTKKLVLELESLQHQAFTKSMRLQRHTAVKVARAMLGKTSLAIQRMRSKLRYRGRLLAMDANRITKQVVLEPVAYANGPLPLRAITGPTIRSSEALQKSYNHLHNTYRDHGITLPDPDAELERKLRLRSAMANWMREVDAWANQQEISQLQETAGNPRSQSRLLARALQDCDTLQPLQVTKAASSVIRRRMMAGSAAVNSLMAKISPQARSTTCICGASDETIEHVILQCPKYLQTRGKALREEAPAACTCDECCVDTLNHLEDPMERCIFILGGPINGVTPCMKVDSCFNNMIKNIWRMRSVALEKIHGVIGKKRARSRRGSRQQNNAGIERFFAPLKRTRTAGALAAPAQVSSGGTHLPPRAPQHPPQHPTPPFSPPLQSCSSSSCSLQANVPSAERDSSAPTGSQLVIDIQLPRPPLGGEVEAHVSDLLR